MNEKEIRNQIELIIKEMLGSTKANGTTDKISQPTKQAVNGSNISQEIIADIAKVDLKKQFLVNKPKNRDAYIKMKSYTPARIGIGRAGERYKTETVLRFRADHAAAQDSVFSYVNENFVKDLNALSIETMCKDKDEYLTRPDLGRRFSEDTKSKIKAYIKGKPDVVLVIGDGLSSAAIEANARDIIPALKQGLNSFNLTCSDTIFVKHARVGCMDVISEITGADVTIILIGERPGLITAKSMSAYIAYKATVGMPEARRTVISNIHSGGTPAVEAGAHIAQVIKIMLDKKASGVDLRL